MIGLAAKRKQFVNTAPIRHPGACAPLQKATAMPSVPAHRPARVGILGTAGIAASHRAATRYQADAAIAAGPSEAIASAVAAERSRRAAASIPTSSAGVRSDSSDDTPGARPFTTASASASAW